MTPSASSGFDLSARCGPPTDAARSLAGAIYVPRAVQPAVEQLIALVFPDRQADPELRSSVQKAVERDLRTICQVIAGHTSVHGGSDTGAAALAGLAAQTAIPVDRFEHGYRTALGVLWTVWYAEARSHAEEHATPLADLIGAPTVLFLGYADTVLPEVLARYGQAPLGGPLTLEQRRRRTLAQVLDDSVSPRVLAEALGLTPDAEHVAYLLQGDHQADHLDLADRVAHAAESTSHVVHHHGETAWLTWLSREQVFGRQRILTLHDHLRATGARIAVGAPATGAEGFGITGREAVEVGRLQGLIPAAAQLLSHDDVRLETLMLTDLAKARRFIVSELGALDGPAPLQRRHRETALAWLSTGSYVAAGDQLGLHEHTVRNRVAQIERLFDGGLTSRRAELLAALRLRRLLGDGP